MKEDLTVKTFDRHASESFFFTFDEPLSWACFTVCEARHIFSVTSDWGHASATWPTNALPDRDDDALKRFLAGADADYVLRKLADNQPVLKARTEFDADATRREFRDLVLEQRRDRSLTRSHARQLWHDVDDFLADVADGGVEHGYVSHAGSELNHDLFDCQIYDFVAMRDSPRVTFWRERLLPLFTTWLRDAGYGASYPAQETQTT